MSETDELEVSVIIPVYNRVNALDKALRSVASQISPPKEVIVVDDGSSPKMAESIQNIASSYGAKHVRMPRNSGGPALPRNIGADLAASNLIAFLDSDDLWFPQRLATFKSDYNESAGLHFALLLRRHDVLKRYRRTLRLLSGDFLADLRTFGNFIPLSSTIVSKELFKRVGGFSTKLNLAGIEDFDLWCKLAKGGANYSFSDSVIGAYGESDDSLSKAKRRKDPILTLSATHCEIFECQNRPLPKWLRRRLLSHLLYSGRYREAISMAVRGRTIPKFDEAA